jgi:hypothetical protein
LKEEKARKKREFITVSPFWPFLTDRRLRIWENRFSCDKFKDRSRSFSPFPLQYYSFSTSSYHRRCKIH